jgi:signal transduction histidine kinase
MTAGRFSSRTAIDTGDEFDVLGQSFNSMAEKLENVIETLRSFVADSAHELLTPVSALRLNLELAADGEEYQQFLDEAQNQAVRLQALVDSMLDLSKIEAGEIQHVPVSLATILDRIEKNFSPIAEGKMVSLEIENPVAEALILGDRDQITRALENLVDNAIKFSKPGGEVRVAIHESTSEWKIRVEDEGIGIPRTEMPKVFQRFFRGRNTATYPGSGLGLAIVQAIADRHGAEVELKSSPAGTKVTLRFPKYQSETQQKKG